MKFALSDYASQYNYSVYCRVNKFEYTTACAFFDLLGIPLLHGWVADPQQKELGGFLFFSDFIATVLLADVCLLQLLESRDFDVNCFCWRKIVEMFPHFIVFLFLARQYLIEFFVHCCYDLLTDCGICELAVFVRPEVKTQVHWNCWNIFKKCLIPLSTC